MHNLQYSSAGNNISAHQYMSGRFSGTIKDTWTKPRERVEAKEGDGFGWGWGEWCGENADNCN